jgi:hypothetical protein
VFELRDEFFVVRLLHSRLLDVVSVDDYALMVVL